jgi:hypothetical protein
MKILELLDATLVLVDLEVNLGDNKQNSPDSLCQVQWKNYSPQYARWKANTNEHR